MTNEQLMILLDGYRDRLQVAINNLRDQLPPDMPRSEQRVYKETKFFAPKEWLDNPENYSIDYGEFDCLRELNNVLASFDGHISMLEPTPSAA